MAASMAASAASSAMVDGASAAMIMAQAQATVTAIFVEGFAKIAQTLAEAAIAASKHGGQTLGSAAARS